ncbi:MAG: serine/threonine-protein kinase [Cyanobacteria bacterium P01_A01_bin.105]
MNSQTVLQNGKYRIEAALGEGGFGVTYRAVRLPINQTVVIKTVHESAWNQTGSGSGSMQQQFQQEARRLAQCQHPNIVNVTDFFIERGQPYLVMDYIPGQSVSEMVFPNRPLPEATALQYINQIGDALRAVHQQGLLHRDVKPQNIMIHDLTGEAILIDFGIARELQAGQTQTHTSIVSDGYAPVEQYLPKARRSAATDVYGLAATLYALVTGEVPLASVLRSHQPLVPPRQFNPALSPHIEAAILQGMAVELTQRPQSIATWQSLLKPGARPSRRGAQTVTGPTQVVAPRVPTQVATQSHTVAVNAPPAYAQPAPTPAYPAPKSRPPRRAANPLKTLGSLLTLALLAAAGMAGYRLYQQASQAIASFEPPSIEVKLPDVQLPDVASWGEAVQDILPDNFPNDNSPDNDPAAPAPEAPDPVVEAPAADVTAPILNRLPMLLANLRSQPARGDGQVVTVPGFAPGTQANQILNRLGQPTRQAAQENFSTAVYDLIPNRASVAYVYDQASNTVQQAEAAFAPTFDRLVMRIALTGMLGGQSTKAIESGLDAVRTEQQPSYTFEQGSFEGVIERTEKGYIHIHVRPKG